MIKNSDQRFFLLLYIYEVHMYFVPCDNGRNISLTSLCAPVAQRKFLNWITQRNNPVSTKPKAGLKIIAGPQTMSGQNVDLTNQNCRLPVMLTIQAMLRQTHCSSIWNIPSLAWWSHCSHRKWRSFFKNPGKVEFRCQLRFVWASIRDF